MHCYCEVSKKKGINKQFFSGHKQFFSVNRWPEVFLNLYFNSFCYRTHDYWFWYPIVGQLIGGIIGGLLYTLTISMHHPEANNQIEVSNNSNSVKRDTEM